MHKSLNKLVAEKRNTLYYEGASLVKMSEYLRCFDSDINRVLFDSCHIEVLLNDGNVNSYIPIYDVSNKLSLLNIDENHSHPFFVKSGLTFCNLRFIIKINKLIFNVDITVLMKKFMESNIGEQDFISEMRNVVQEQLELKLASNDFKLDE